MDCKAPIISEISERMKQVGDLPLFSATVNRIRQISADPDSTAMALSNEITKDTNLTATLLRISNSSYYNRGAGKIAAISRAVVILGYETIMNLSLTLKLIDSFQQEHPSIDINKILVNAYQAASFARELALKTGIRNIEETYTCTLMHNLGEIVVAYFLPEKYLRLVDLSQHANDMKGSQIEHEVLGAQLQEIGQCLAQAWEFPSTIINTMESYDTKNTARARGSVQINHALSSLSTMMVGRLHDQHQVESVPVEELMNKMSSTVGLDPSIIEGCLMESFKMSCELANDFGLDKKILAPAVKDSGDELRDRIAGRMAYATSNYSGNTVPVAEPELETEIKTTVTNNETTTEPIPSDQQTHAPKDDEIEPAENQPPPTPDPNQQLQYIHEITALLSSTSNLNTIFAKSVEAIQRSAGFNRAALCLLHPDHSQYSARIVLGDDDGQLKPCLNAAVDIEHDLLSKIIFDGDQMIVQDVNSGKWSDIMRDDFISQAHTESFIIASLRLDNKPVGLFYADVTSRGATIANIQQRGFNQFVAQARLALKINSQSS